MSKPKIRSTPDTTVRSRRAYFDCRYGQLHVRTAFPATGGFDEQVTLLCLHPEGASSRAFSDFLPLAALQRSVYAPDLPGCGESDPAAAGGEFATVAAAAVADLVADLRLRRIDVIGLHSGAAVAVELALLRPALVRALVLAGAAPPQRLALLGQQTASPQVHRIDPAGIPATPPGRSASELLARMDQALGAPGARPAA